MNEVVVLEKLVIEIKFYSQQSAQSVIEIGKRLIQAKEQIPHGQWGKWLKEQFNYTERTAQRFIKCAERFGNTTTSSHLNPSIMFELLALPEETTEQFVKEHNVEEMSVRELREVMRKQKEAEEKLNQMQLENQIQVDNLRLKNERLRDANNVLENKLRSAGEPVIVEQPVQVFPPDYERIKRENTELKARQQNISLERMVKVNGNCRQYAKSEIEKEKLSKQMNKLLSVLAELPDKNDLAEMACCYLQYSVADTADEVTATCAELENAIDSLQKIKQALISTTKLRVVK